MKNKKDSNRRTLFRMIIMVIVIFSAATASQIGAPSAQVLRPTREVPVTLKVVLVGFEEQWVDRDYFVWDYQTPSRGSNLVWNRGNWQQTGVTYKISYNLTFATPGFKDELLSYLKTIGEKKKGENPWFSYSYSYSASTNYVVYDAGKVEEWLHQHADGYGGSPENSWTFIVMYLPELTKFTVGQLRAWWDQGSVGSQLMHYYGIEAVDSDLGYKLQHRDFMNGYGGHHRMWFVDLSAGPISESPWNELPLDTVIEDQKIQLDTPFGRQWLTQLLSDHTAQMVHNIVLPEFVYDPIYTAKYMLVVKVLDYRTDEEKKAIPIRSTINENTIRHAFEDLVPYTSVEVNIQFDDASVYPELQKLVWESRRTVDSYIYNEVFGENTFDYVDERPVYKYLQNNLRSFVPNIHRDETELTIPIFAFAFSGDTHFAYSSNWLVQKAPERTYGGTANGDLVIIGANHLDFHLGDEEKQEGKGLGLTQTVIHEAGHMVGLSHPDAYWAIGGFCFTAMSSYTQDYLFGQNDKDAIQRIHADKLLLQAMDLEEQSRVQYASKVADLSVETKLSEVRDRIHESENLYATMSYSESLKVGLEARHLARSTLEQIVQLAPSTERIKQLEANLTQTRNELTATKNQLPVYLAAGLGIGFVVAVFVFLIMRRQVAHGTQQNALRKEKDEIRSTDAS